MIQPKSKNVLYGVTITNVNRVTATFSSTGPTNTQTFTITTGGVGIVFTFVTSIGSTAGNVLIGASNAETIANLVYAINHPDITSTTQVKLTTANINLLRGLNITAEGVTTAATTTVNQLMIKNPNQSTMAVTTTGSNVALAIYSESDPIPGYGKKSISMIAVGGSAGTGTYSVEVSDCCVNWTTYNRLNSNVTNTNAQGDTRVASVVLTLNGSTINYVTNTATFPVDDVFAYFKVKVVPATAGTYYAGVTYDAF